jgi:hypothetical protein
MSSARTGSGSLIKRLALWDYSRDSHPYGIMVALILAFIFLTPRSLFRDQPKPKNIVEVTVEHGTSGFWIEPELLANVPEQDRLSAAQRLVRSQAGGKNRNVLKLEPIYDVEKELIGFRAHTKP